MSSNSQQSQLSYQEGLLIRKSQWLLVILQVSQAFGKDSRLKNLNADSEFAGQTDESFLKNLILGSLIYWCYQSYRYVH